MSIIIRSLLSLCVRNYCDIEICPQLITHCKGGRSHIFKLRLCSFSKKFESWIQVRNIFKFENPTPVQTSATIDATDIKQCLYLINYIYKDHADSCCCRKSGSGTGSTKLQKFMTAAPGMKKNAESCRISCRISLRIRGCFSYVAHNVQLLKAF